MASDDTKWSRKSKRRQRRKHTKHWQDLGIDEHNISEYCDLHRRGEFSSHMISLQVELMSIYSIIG